MLYDALAERIRRDTALMVVCAIATLPLFSNTFMGQAASGFADIPFAFYWTGFLLCGTRLPSRHARASWPLLIFFAIGCVFTKNEGWPAILLLGVSVSLLRTEKIAGARG